MNFFLVNSIINEILNDMYDMNETSSISNSKRLLYFYGDVIYTITIG